MKVRSGFVSNSSSSSFILIKKDQSLSKEELIKRINDVYRKAYDNEYIEDSKDDIENMADRKEYCVFIKSIDHGVDASEIEDMVNTLIQHFNGNTNDYIMEWSD